MENEKRLIDADAFECVCVNGKSDDFCNGVLCVLDMIDAQPTVDAVEVTRCENCTRGDPEDCPDGRVWCTKMCRYMKLDGFCSFGDRRSDG